jgi:tryptophan synthase alpha subunit
LRPHGLTFVPLIAPTTSLERTVEAAKGVEDSFLYVITVKGTTGARTELPPELKERLAAIRTAVNMPIAAGFGISTKEQVKVIGEVADGFIVGSALVKMLAKDGKIHPEELSF